MKRESGYYWVKKVKTGAWRIAYYHNNINEWRVFGHSNIEFYQNSYFEYINETRIQTPDETYTIENIMERWLHGRSNDGETLDAIQQELFKQGKLKFWNNDKATKKSNIKAP